MPGVADPTDAEIEARLAAAPASAFVELWAAADALAAEDVHGTWAGGDVVGRVDRRRVTT